MSQGCGFYGQIKQIVMRYIFERLRARTWLSSLDEMLKATNWEP